MKKADHGNEGQCVASARRVSKRDRPDTVHFLPLRRPAKQFIEMIASYHFWLGTLDVWPSAHELTLQCQD